MAADPPDNPMDNPTDEATDNLKAYQSRQIASDQLLADANRRYRLLVPDALALADGERLPLVVYLHGAGAKGDDNARPVQAGLPRLLATPQMRQRFACFVLVPQCRAGTTPDGRPNNWVNWVGQKDNPPANWHVADALASDQLRAAMLALDEVIADHPIDVSRVYLAGASMGGSGACYWAALEPRRFAAVAVVCGLSEPYKAPALAHTRLWLFHGSQDPIVPVQRTRDLAAAMQAAGGEVRITEYPDAGHNIADGVWSENDHAVLHWLFEQRRGED